MKFDGETLTARKLFYRASQRTHHHRSLIQRDKGDDIGQLFRKGGEVSLVHDDPRPEHALPAYSDPFQIIVQGLRVDRRRRENITARAARALQTQDTLAASLPEQPI